MIETDGNHYEELLVALEQTREVEPTIIADRYKLVATGVDKKVYQRI